MDIEFPLRSAFLALPLEGEAKLRFQVFQRVLLPFEDILRFQNPQSPHLTLQFWREVMEIEYDGILSQAEKIAAASSPFAIHVMGAETFGSREGDRVLFLTIAFSDELARVKKLCPWPDGKEFSPHITLARISHPQRFVRAKKKVMKEFRDCGFDISFDRLRLYAEVDGVKQTALKDFVFSAGPR